MNDCLSDALDLSGGRPALRNAGSVRDNIDAIVRLAVFGDGSDQTLARFAIHAAAPELGAVPSSIAPLYAARGRGEVAGFTVPAVNIRGHRLRHVPRALPSDEEPARDRHGVRIGTVGDGLHVPGSGRAFGRGAGRRDCGRLPGAGLHTGRPFPGEREEVLHRPGGRNARARRAHQAGHCRAVLLHRHRRFHARRPQLRDRCSTASTEREADGAAREARA